MKLASAGNALVDVIATENDELGALMGIHRGTTRHASRAEINSLLERLADPIMVAGGGAANTARAFAALGGAAAYAGAVGSDALGKHYTDDLVSAGVRSFVQAREGLTGIFCVLQPASGTRTVVVEPGVAPTLDPAAIPDDFFAGSDLVYADGFLALGDAVLSRLAERARERGIRFALDIGSKRLASTHRSLFMRMIKEDCDWVFMNEDEFTTLAGAGVDEALAPFASGAKGTVVVKRAASGSVCMHDGRIVESSVRSIDVFDETGAGDAFSAGFLMAALSGSPVPRCLRLGNWTAERAIQVPGMALDAQAMKRMLSTVL